LERAGNSDRGSITGLFNVLVEADDMNDPVGDAARSVLDGHLVLSRELAAHNHYPAIDVLGSVSRLAQDLLSEEEKGLVGHSRDTLAVYRKNQDLISIGAYERGSTPAIDSAIQKHDPLNKFLRQDVGETVSRKDSWDQLKSVMSMPDEGKPEVAPESKSQSVPADMVPQAAPQMPMLNSGLAGMHMARQPSAVKEGN